ncbi:MAG: hypothetical protein ACOVO3_03725 [Fluviicola sp.]
MVSFKFQDLKREWPQKLQSSNWLWIWNADKIPPHIGISVEKDYFSLTYRESERKLTTSMIAKAKRSQIPLLLLRLSSDIQVSTAVKVFGNFNQAVVGGPTCLTPIKALLDAPNTVLQLAHLLDFIASKQVSLEVFAVHLGEDFTELPRYSVDQIMNRINELHATKR